MHSAPAPWQMILLNPRPPMLYHLLVTLPEAPNVVQFDNLYIDWAQPEPALEPGSCTLLNLDATAEQQLVCSLTAADVEGMGKSQLPTRRQWAKGLRRPRRNLEHKKRDSQHADVLLELVDALG